MQGSILQIPSDARDPAIAETAKEYKLNKNTVSALVEPGFQTPEALLSDLDRKGVKYEIDPKVMGLIREGKIGLLPPKERGEILRIFLRPFIPNDDGELYFNEETVRLKLSLVGNTLITETWDKPASKGILHQKIRFVQGQRVDFTTLVPEDKWITREEYNQLSTLSPQSRIDQQSTPEKLPSLGSADAPHNLASLLASFDRLPGLRSGEWKADDPRAKQFLQEYGNLKVALSSFPSGTFDSTGAVGMGAIAKVNSWLQSKKASVRLSSPESPSNAAAASIMDIKVQWVKVGTEKSLTLRSGNTVPGVEMGKENQVSFYQSGNTPVVELSTQQGYKVFIAPNTAGGSAYEVAKRLSSGKSASSEYDKVHFPKVNFFEDGKIDWMVGMKKDDFTIREAVFAHKFTMDEKGATARAEAAAAGSRGLSRSKTLTIDGPFVVWFDYNGTIPFAANINDKNMNSGTGK